MTIEKENNLRSKAEQEDIPELKTWLFNERETISRALSMCLRTLGAGKETRVLTSNEELVSELERLNSSEDLYGQIPDILFYGGPSYKEHAKKEIETITKNENITLRPIIIAMNLMEGVNRELLRGGANLRIQEGAPDLMNIMELTAGIREMLGEVESLYPELLLKEKEKYYDEYVEIIRARAEITADIQNELKVLEEILDKNQVKDIIDAGCGYGRIAFPLADKQTDAGDQKYKITGVDISGGMLNAAKEINDQKDAGSKVGLVQGDIMKMPVPDEQTDSVILNWHTFCELRGGKNRMNVLNEAFRVLRPGGILILDMPSIEDSGKKKVEYIGPAREKGQYRGEILSEGAMLDLLSSTGFQDVEVKHWTTNQEFKKVVYVAHKN